MLAVRFRSCMQFLFGATFWVPESRFGCGVSFAFLVCRSFGPRVCIPMAVVGRVASGFFWWAFVRFSNTMRCERVPGTHKLYESPARKQG